MLKKGIRVEPQTFRKEVWRRIGGKLVPVWAEDDDGNVIMDGDEPRIAVDEFIRPVQVEVPLTAEEIAEGEARAVDHAAFISDPEREVEKDLDWLLSKFDRRRQARLFYDICKAIQQASPGNMSQLMTTFVDKFDSVRTDRQSEEAARQVRP